MSFIKILATVLLLLLASAADAQDLPWTTASLKSAMAGAALRADDGVLFQVSTLDALLQGVYGGSMTVGELKRRGDFGVGTYAGLDGEMIVVDGHYYHMRANGVVTEAGDDEVAPFAVVTRFKPGVQFTVKDSTMADLSTLVDSVLPSKNLFYAIRVHGVFGTMTTRAIPIQFMPYLPLAQLIPTQTVFNYSNVTGTVVGIRSPQYVSGVNQAGHHFHFVSDDLKGGGHALSFTTGPVTVEIQTLRRYSLWLPEDEPFLNATLPIQ